MLWGYFDESGEHEPDDAPPEIRGTLKKLTLAGGWASYERWQAFSLDWADALDQFGIEWFHMTDFEASKGEFEGWRDFPDKRHSLLNRLIDIIRAHIPDWTGATMDVLPIHSFNFIYDRLLKQTFEAAAHRQEDMALILARHPEYSSTRLGQLYTAISTIEPAFKSSTMADPKSHCPLQAADFVAYELARFHRYPSPERYPWRRLNEGRFSTLSF